MLADDERVGALLYTSSQTDLRHPRFATQRSAVDQLQLDEEYSSSSSVLQHKTADPPTSEREGGVRCLVLSLMKVEDLSDDAWEEAFEEFQRLKAAAIAERNRARVVGGLPDCVAIQEGKSLNLTGNVWGEPTPEVSWTKNDKELVSDERYKLKFEAGKFASITIAAVTTADSGKYALVVKNKYGTEAGEFTVSVYNPDDEEAKKD
ncbi:hypothetical protein WMY93_027711 [Mugilogobius chulae]|uniref:Ig-like domain-containing protein n=1 Tax=Mugilogobius chulae TaxID=88201 RepID=A0AAW0MTR5_9GOBI